MFRILALTVLILLGTLAKGEETSPPLRLSGGIICDTLDDVIATLESGTPAPTCGRLHGTHVGTVTPVVEYTANANVFNLVRYDFMPSPYLPPVQYGWFGKPVPIPASLEQDT